MNYILLTLADIRYVVLLSSLMSEICTACGGGHLGWCCMQSVQGKCSECCYAGGREQPIQKPLSDQVCQDSQNVRRAFHIDEGKAALFFF